MSRFDDQPATVRWVLRTAFHAVDGYALIGSVVAALLALVSVIQAQVPQLLSGNLSTAAATTIGYWAGRASLLLFIAVVVQAAARAGMDEGMTRLRRNPSHVRDLQQQAGVMRQYLRQVHGYPAIDLRSVAARNLCQHFPSVAAEIENWNHAAGEYRTALDVLNQRRDQEVARPIVGTQATFVGVLMFAAMGSYSPPLEVIWSVQAQTSLQFRDPKTEQDIGVSTVPSGIDPLDFAAKVQERLTEAGTWPQAVSYRESVERLDGLKPGLDRMLQEIELDHAPGGACGTCRPPRTSQNR